MFFACCLFIFFFFSFFLFVSVFSFTFSFFFFGAGFLYIKITTDIRVYLIYVQFSLVIWFDGVQPLLGIKCRIMHLDIMNQKHIMSVTLAFKLARAHLFAVLSMAMPQLTSSNIVVERTFSFDL